MTFKMEEWRVKIHFHGVFKPNGEQVKQLSDESDWQWAEGDAAVWRDDDYKPAPGELSNGVVMEIYKADGVLKNQVLTVRRAYPELKLLSFEELQDHYTAHYTTFSASRFAHTQRQTDEQKAAGAQKGYVKDDIDALRRGVSKVWDIGKK